MKRYSSRKAKKGKTAYRTPSKFIYKKDLQTKKSKAGKNKSNLKIRKEKY